MKANKYIYIYLVMEYKVGSVNVVLFFYILKGQSTNFKLLVYR